MRAGAAAVVAVAVVPSTFARAGGPDALATAPSADVTIVDDTNFLTVTVPAEWAEHNTVSGLHDDGSDRPQISAAPNLQQFFETFDGSGLYVVAGPSTTDPATVLALNDWSGVCSDGGVVAYDDGRFVGLQ
jgi:hypothetical protein